MTTNYYTSTTSSCDSTWSTWNNCGYTTIASSGSSDTTWTVWSSGTVTATTTCSSTASTWDYWNNATYKIINSYEAKPIELTEVQKAAQEKQRLKIEEESRLRQLKEKEKEENARQLLKEVLTDEQNEQLDKNGYFELVSVKSGNKYRINKGRTRNVELLKKDGTVDRRLCFHPTDYVHNYDTMVAQKLMLENDEEEVKKVANYS